MEADLLAQMRDVAKVYGRPAARCTGHAALVAAMNRNLRNTRRLPRQNAAAYS
jgi:hypothetical protein